MYKLFKQSIFFIIAISGMSVISYAQATSGGASQSQTAPGATAPTPEVNYWKQPYLTGDWDGKRTKLKAKGVDLQFRLTQSYMGLVAGGVGDNSAYSGKFDTNFKFDMQKLAGWKGFSWQIKTETRFGKSPRVGMLLQPNSSILTPVAAGTVFSVTALNFTQMIPLQPEKGNFIAFGAGKFYSLDSVNEPFHGGAGHTKFLSVGLNGTPTVGATVPMVTNGGTLAWVRKGSPFITVALFDAVGSFTNPGIKNLFSTGVTIVPGINFPTKFGGKSGKHSFSATYSTKKYTNFNNIRDLIIPGPALAPFAPRSGSWSATYTFHQYFSEKVVDGVKTGWGVFGVGSIADKETNPVSLFYTIGIGGNGIIKKRPNDRFGAAFEFTGVSSTLRNQLRPLTVVGNEKEFEAFYNFALTPFLSLTADLQVIRPVLRPLDTAVVPGARLVVNF